jgi:hypothetical protein
MTPTQLSKAVGISVPFASQLLSDPPKRNPSLEKAFQIYDLTGLQLGALANLTAKEIEMQRRLAEKQAA